VLKILREVKFNLIKIYYSLWVLRVVSVHLIKIYRVIQEESTRLREMIVCVILSKKVHINMCPILGGYGVMTVF